MTLTKENLFRCLPLLFNSTEFQIEQNIVYYRDAGKHLEIHIQELPILSLGSLQLPQLLLKFRFHNHTDIQIDKFMKLFKQTNQRGGG